MAAPLASEPGTPGCTSSRNQSFAWQTVASKKFGGTIVVCTQLAHSFERKGFRSVGNTPLGRRQDAQGSHPLPSRKRCSAGNSISGERGHNPSGHR